MEYPYIVIPGEEGEGLSIQKHHNDPCDPVALTEDDWILLLLLGLLLKEKEIPGKLTVTPGAGLTPMTDGWVQTNNVLNARFKALNAQVQLQPLLENQGSQWRLALPAEQVLFSPRLFEGSLFLKDRKVNGGDLKIEMRPISTQYFTFTPTAPVLHDPSITPAVAKALLFMNMNPVGIVTFEFRQHLEYFWNTVGDILYGPGSKLNLKWLLEKLTAGPNAQQDLDNLRKRIEQNVPQLLQVQNTLTSTAEENRLRGVISNALTAIRNNPRIPWFIELLADVIDKDYRRHFEVLWSECVITIQDMLDWIQYPNNTVAAQKILHNPARWAQGFNTFINRLRYSRSWEMKVPEQFRDILRHCGSVNNFYQTQCQFYDYFKIQGWDLQWFLYYLIDFKIYVDEERECIAPIYAPANQERAVSQPSGYNSLSAAGYTHTEPQPNSAAPNPVCSGTFSNYLAANGLNTQLFNAGIVNGGAVRHICDENSGDVFENLLHNPEPINNGDVITAYPGLEQDVWGYLSFS